MSVIWVDEANGNRFGNKHLYIVSGAVPLGNLVGEGFQVFDDRVRSNYLANLYDKDYHERQEARQLKNKYGTTNASTNTMIMLTKGGLSSLESQILHFRNSSGDYKVDNGIIFNTTQNGYSASLIATVNLSIRNVGSNKEVYHLNGAYTTAVLKNMNRDSNSRIKIGNVPAQYGSNILGMKFTPTQNELSNMRSQLRKV